MNERHDRDGPPAAQHPSDEADAAQQRASTAALIHKAAFTKASLRRAIEATERAGKRVVGVRPDGTLIVDDGDQPHPLIPDARAVMETRHAAPSSKWEDIEV